MRRRFWVLAIAILFIFSLASIADAQVRRGWVERRGPDGLKQAPGQNKPEDHPSNGNQGEEPGHGTPDGLTPAEEDWCDDLKHGTPGLYGLCIAFCEAQDSQCIPDFEAENPVGHCRMRDQRILEQYDRKRRDGDPDMPCLPSAGEDPQYACPCWSQADLEYYPLSLTSMDPSWSWPWSDIDFQHDFYDGDEGEEEYVCTQYETYIGEASDLADGGSFFFWIEATQGDCDDGNYCSSAISCLDSETCPPEYASEQGYAWGFYDLSEEEYLNCKMAIEQLIATY